jgi:hypothetical protein
MMKRMGAAFLIVLPLICLGCSESATPTKPKVVSNEKAPATAEKLMAEPASGTIEDLFAKVDALPAGTKTFELYVPNSLTMKGQPVAQNLAMALVLDRILGKKLYPDGFEQKENGRLYRYTWELKERK